MKGGRKNPLMLSPDNQKAIIDSKEMIDTYMFEAERGLRSNFPDMEKHVKQATAMMQQRAQILREYGVDVAENDI